jgi:hypothetical protein
VLKAQNALADNESLTVIGKMLSNLPVDVVIGKMLIMGTLFNQVDAVLSLAAALSVQSPFTNDAYRNSDCVAARRNLDSDHGDPITLLNSFREWLEIKATDRENTRKWCKKRGLEEQRFYEMTKLRQQFRDLLEDAGLLKKDIKDLSSAERTKRHGELQTLRNMKKDFHKSEGPRKKKFLKMRMFDNGDDDEEADSKVDIKDIEFRMRNDANKVLQSSKVISYKDLNLLKLILTSGLYPQVAMADEFNGYKSGADQLFHTRVKPFNVLHPNSAFATYPEYTTLDSMDIINVPGFASKFPVSAKHQILIYLTLLETNKPYLINTMRMPALQSLLLFAKDVDTNINFSRLVFDAWLEVRFPDPEQGQNVLLTAFKLRSMWQELLTSKLLDDQDEDKQLKLETKLSKGLVDFVHTETLFSMRRLLPGDLKIAFVGPEQGQEVSVDENPFGNEVQINQTRGGFLLNESLTYNCLVNTGDELVSNCIQFECPVCKEVKYTSHLDRMCHYAQCMKHEEDIKEELETEETRKLDPNAREYDCKECGKVLYLTSTEILRHSRSH